MMFYLWFTMFIMYHNILQVFHDVLLCLTMFYVCRQRSASPQGSRQRHRDHDNSAEIGDNSAEIGDDTAGFVDIAAKVILC